VYTPELILALQCQAAVIVLTVLVGIFVLRVPSQTAVWAGLLFNSLPVTSPSGYDTPIFIHDMLVPVLAFMTLLGRAWTKDRIIWLVAATALVWPMTGSLVAFSLGEDGNQWIVFAARRIGFVFFFVVGLSGLLPKIRGGQFLDCCVLAWVLMLIPALLQYFGVIDTDIHPLEEVELRGVSIWESAAAQRGFLGMNRGAVGVWGSAIASYCLVNFFLNQQSGRARWLLYIVGAVFSYVVILFSGTRTGLLAAVGGALFVCVRLFVVRNQVRAPRILAFGSVAVLAGIYLLGPAVARIAERFSVESAALGTGQSRIGVQAQTINYLVQDLRASVIGMGPSATQFYDRVGQKTEDLLQHPHSEFLEVLWQGGFLGLLLYLAMLGGIYFGISVPRTSPFHRQSLAGHSMFVAGIISGLAVGNIMITTPRLATFGLFMAFVYGRLTRDARLARADSAQEEEFVEETPEDETTNIMPLPAPGLLPVASIDQRSR
jgi:O-antigen ligase